MKLSISLLILLILVSSCVKILEKEPVFNPSILTQEECSNARGHWNDCGSPCLGTGADYCIEVCEAHCECGGIAGFGCPEGYSCRLTRKIADEMGVCVKE